MYTYLYTFIYEGMSTCYLVKKGRESSAKQIDRGPLAQNFNIDYFFSNQCKLVRKYN